MENELETTTPTRRVVTVGEAAAILQISRGAAYEAAKPRNSRPFVLGAACLCRWQHWSACSPATPPPEGN